MHFYSNRGTYRTW